jgi:ribokinase
MAAKKILVVGSANMDLSMNVFRVPAAGETVIDDGGVGYTPGGKGANAAMALMKMGANAVLCAKLGQDVHGQRLYNYYKEMGMDTSCLKADHDFPTGLAVVIKEADGQNRIVVYPGANSNLTTDNVMDAFECNPDAVYIGFEIPFNIALTAAKVASAKGIPVFVDSAPAKRDHPLEALPPVEIFSPNETETEEYTGILPQGMESSLRAALSLYKRVKAKYIVIKQGSRGAFIYDGKHYDTLPAIRADKTVDTTAAGDAFTAALVVEYLRNGGDIKSAVKYANAAGAITVTRKGASSSVANDVEIRALLEKQGL